MTPPDTLRPTPTLRRALEADLPAVVRLFSIPDEGNRKQDDPGPPLDPRYREALLAIADDPNNALLVAELDGRVVGAFQLTLIQHVAYRGGRVAQIENVIVDPDARGRGIGEAMMRWAIDEARRRACFRVQLTTNKVRRRAHRFYERLGFVASHEGMKLAL
jgi:ribosomal protein S18 acetylase RimI-like enzyme